LLKIAATLILNQPTNIKITFLYRRHLKVATSEAMTVADDLTTLSIFKKNLKTVWPIL